MRRVALLALLLVAVAPQAAAAGTPPPGGPGEPALWTEGDKDGFGTSTTLASKVWHTLDDGELT
jgi:glucoamylase